MERQESNFISPLMFIGIFIFAAPIVLNIFRLQMPGWISGIGLIVIFIGAGHTMWARFSE